MSRFTKTLYKISDALQRQMQPSEAGGAMFAPTNTAPMKTPSDQTERTFT